MILLLVLSIFFSQTFALYPSHSEVINLTPSNFDKLVVNSDEVWVVEFFAPWCGHCQKLVPEYQKAAKSLKGVVKVGAVDADEHKSLAGRFSIRGFPTIKIFGSDKNKPDDYNGERSAEGLVKGALAAAKEKVYAHLGGKSKKSSEEDNNGKDVIELTDSNFDRLVLQSDDMWLVEFYAPWCGHCKNLAPHWSKAATELKGKIKVGALDATVHTSTASKYGIQGYPTIKHFPLGKKTADSATDYTGERTSSGIVSWALEELAENIPAPEVVQIVSEQNFNEACAQKSLCIISVLPHILDCQSACRNEYLNILKSMSEKYKKKQWGWMWSEAGVQSNLEDSLDIGGFGYPAMAVVNPKKMKYMILRGSFSSEGIEEFLRNLSYGRGNTTPVKDNKLPEIVPSEPWDGKDGELPAEEDIDLSDVVLDDEKDEL